MRWKVESVTPSDDKVTAIVRIEITRDDGTTFHDQNAVPLTATPEAVRKMCEEMCAKHEQPDPPNLDHWMDLQG